MPRKLQHRLGGRLYNILLDARIDDLGQCSDPNVSNRVIKIAKGLDEKELMEVAIHEALHACGWILDEEFVDLTAQDIATLLYKLGYRLEKVKDEEK